jgi:hypothetical protein
MTFSGGGGVGFKISFPRLGLGTIFEEDTTLGKFELEFVRLLVADIGESGGDSATGSFLGDGRVEVVIKGTLVGC